MDSDSLTYWGFEFDPFNHGDRSEQFFLSQSHREALDALRRGIADGCRAICLYGPSGTGKSFLLNTLRRWLESKNYLLVFVGAQPGKCLLDKLLHALHFERGALPEHELIPALKACLAREHRRRGLQTVLMVDWPDLLCDAEARAQAGALVGLHRGTNPLVSLIFTGRDGPNSPAWRMANGFRDRVQLTHELRPLQEHETPQYVEHRLRTAGYWDKLFDGSACATIHRLSGGIPSRINALCTRALQAARSRRLRTVNSHLVDDSASMTLSSSHHINAGTEVSEARPVTSLAARSGCAVALPFSATTGPQVLHACVPLTLPRAERLCANVANALQSALERRILRKVAAASSPSTAHQGVCTSEALAIRAQAARGEHSNIILEHFLAAQGRK